MISGIFERTMKRRGVRESDPFDWEKAGSDSTQSEGLGTAVKSTAPQTNKVIITDNVEQQATVDNQENVEPDNMKEVSRVSGCLALSVLNVLSEALVKGEDVGPGDEEEKQERIQSDPGGHRESEQR